MKSKSLTLRQAAGIVIVDACFCILFAWWGCNALQAGDKLGELLFCVAASILFLSLPLYVWNFFRVKRGIPVMVRHGSSSATPQVTFRKACIIMGVLTLVLAATSVLLYIELHASGTLVEGLEVAGEGGFFWLIVGFSWHWLLSNKPPVISLAVQEQPEGVWPPAPLTADVDKIEG